MNSDVLVGAVLGGGGVSGAVLGVLQYWFTRSQRRAEEQRKKHEHWFQEAQAAYERVSNECETCRQELRDSEKSRRAAEERHRKELLFVRRELSDVKDALYTRLDAFDEILPHVAGLPEDRLRDLRAANRAVRRAIYRGDR